MSIEEMIKEPTIEEIIQETTIDFPKPIGLEECEEFFHYLATNLSVDITWNPEYSGSLIHDSNTKELLKHKGALRLEGFIRSLKDSRVHDTFESKSCEEDNAYISGIEFKGGPEWEFSEYTPEVRELWGDVRGFTAKYFEEVLEVNRK